LDLIGTAAVVGAIATLVTAIVAVIQLNQKRQESTKQAWIIGGLIATGLVTGSLILAYSPHLRLGCASRCAT